MYKFAFRPIARKFVKPLVTSHGNWDIREAIIIRLTDEIGRVSWGEIAPISWFGSETLEQALDFCRQLPEEITKEMIFSIPDDLPTCQFGFESALEGLGTRYWGLGTGGDEGDGDNYLQLLPNSPYPMPHAPCPLSYSGLLAAGEVALRQWTRLWEEGYRTFKWKIGVDAIAQELEILHSLIQALPTTAKLRLDANGGLSYEEANLWLETCDNLPGNIEFIEQPLPVGQFPEMLALSEYYSTAIALDESVATLKQLTTAYQQGWRGIFVIKPGIVGSPSRLRQFCQQYQIDAVFSSVFETAIGRQAALQLAAELSHNQRAVGFGINHFFAQEEDTWLQRLWQDL
ncbi:o-succinylbenzoic acid (OSB) synthetase [Calothrix sp. PCC 7507]|nr:o-succinylbenzoic acid (OSB) synthetase [Calothrix sp. PCC 7507]